MLESIAVIGMGQMGSSIAARLAASGYRVVGYDKEPSQRGRLRSKGLSITDTLASAVSGCSAILTSLPDPEAVRDAFLGKDGIVESASPGALCIELSTIDPATMREVASRAAARGLAVVDCPVSGSPTEIEFGGLVVLAGGRREDIARAEPILRLLGGAHRYTGEIGTAKVVKIVNNMMSMSNLVAAAEAFCLGVAGGVEAERLFEVLSASGGRSSQFTKRFPKAIRGDFTPGFKIELGEKDLSLGIELGRNLGIPTPAAAASRELYAMTMAQGFRGQDIVATLAMYQRWAKQDGPLVKDADASNGFSSGAAGAQIGTVE